VTSAARSSAASSCRVSFCCDERRCAGHSSIVTTADTYTSVLPETALRAAQATADMVIKAARSPPGSRLGGTVLPHVPAAQGAVTQWFPSNRAGPRPRTGGPARDPGMPHPWPRNDESCLAFRLNGQVRTGAPPGT
jgi:hypothetical protein